LNRPINSLRTIDGAHSSHSEVPRVRDRHGVLVGKVSLGTVTRTFIGYALTQPSRRCRYCPFSTAIDTPRDHPHRTVDFQTIGGQQLDFPVQSQLSIHRGSCQPRGPKSLNKLRVGSGTEKLSSVSCSWKRSSASGRRIGFTNPNRSFGT
jgi:hypothetical protein